MLVRLFFAIAQELLVLNKGQITNNPFNLGDTAMTTETNNQEDSSVKIEITPQNMAAETNDVDDTSIKIEIIPQSSEMVENQMSGDGDLALETKALIDAIRKRAQSEAVSAGTLTRETYLNAVRKVRESLEDNQLIERDRIEYSWQMLQKEAEKNFELITKEVADLGDRLTDAAKAAWDAFTAPRSREDR